MPPTPGQSFSPTQPPPPAPEPQPQTSQPAPVTPTPVVMPGGTPASVPPFMPPVTNPALEALKSQPPPKRGFLKRLGRKALIIPIVAVLLLGGGAAAAYFGYVVPNKPSNVLIKGVQNTLLAHQLTTTGTFNINEQGVSGKLDYTVALNDDTHATDTKLNLTISGVNVPLEVITDKGNLYFKVGDLSSLESLLSASLGSSSSDVQQLEDQINKNVVNQWIEVDSTLINEAKLSCLTNYPAPFSQSDIQQLQSAYQNSQFANISTHSTDSVNGSAAYKYQLQLDDNTLSQVNLSGVGYVKNLNSCIDKFAPGTNLNLGSQKDNDKTPLTVWVDKSSKRIVKYASQTTAQDKSKDDLTGQLTGTISYGSVNVSAPANAKPVLSLLSEIQGLDLSSLGSLFTDFDTSSAASTSTSAAAKDTMRKTDINALQGQIEAFNTNAGYYPTLANLNDASWRSQNMKGLDTGALQDPDGSAATIVSAPQAKAYSYQVTPAGCDNLKSNCTAYTLTAILSDGTTYSKTGSD